MGASQRSRVAVDTDILTELRALKAAIAAVDEKVDLAVRLGCPVCAPAIVASAHPELVPARPSIELPHEHAATEAAAPNGQA